MQTTLDKKKLIMWLCVIVFPLAILGIPTGEVFTQPIRLFLAVTLCAILMFAFRHCTGQYRLQRLDGQCPLDDHGRSAHCRHLHSGRHS